VGRRSGELLALLEESKGKDSSCLFHFRNRMIAERTAAQGRTVLGQYMGT
jgi:hypothetical protein